MRFRRSLAISVLLIAATCATTYFGWVGSRAGSGGGARVEPSIIPAENMRAIEQALAAGRATEAERGLRAVLNEDPKLTSPRRLLAWLLLTEGRRWEADIHLGLLLKSGDVSVEELVLLGDGRTDFDSPEKLRGFQEAVPDDPVPLLAMARIDFREGRVTAARERLESIVAADPGQIEAQALLGRVLVNQDDRDALAAWHATLPPRADDWPSIWLVRGLHAKATEQQTAAVRCLWEAIRLDPNDAQSHAELANQLLALGQKDAATLFHARAAELHELIDRLKSIYTDRHRLRQRPDSADRLSAVAALMESLSRPWEATAWHRLVTLLDPRRLESAHAIERLESILVDDPPRTLPAGNLAMQFDLSHYPLPEWRLGAPPRREEPLASDSPAIRFEDEAEQTGLQFTYFQRSDPSRAGLYMQETTGGGVAALDYDGDAWPDLYLTQGCPWPPDPNQRDHLDALFRNTGAGRFVDVTSTAGLGDERYGQGICAGDYDNDGFADLYLANVGGNRLYRNNGDGTFLEFTHAAGIVAEDWTTSCLIADVNGDSYPDLYDVNYLEGPDVYSRVCEDKGHPTACTPYVFSPQHDRLWLGLGDGRFADQSSACGILAPGGNGLGIVAAEFETDGRLELFIANDQTPNFLFTNQAPRGVAPEFTEQALLRGVAVDREGRSQACMGISIDDANGDGHLDLFVTNFIHEFNTLYLQSAASGAGGTFRDGTIEAGLSAASLDMVGFGTQFVDADLDGWPDLIVTNGHIDDFGFQGEPFHMRPQFFRNLGGGRYHELSAATLGPFFAGQYLGRGMARVDWNRDGRDDLVVSHLDSPAALLTNRTHDPGRHLALQFRGVRHDRDAIGTTVRAKVGDRLIVKQLTVGDGYQASNQRQIVIGLGNNEQVDVLSVEWLGGVVEEFRNLPADTSWILVEGATAPVASPSMAH